MNLIVEVTVFLDLRGTASARLASDRHRPTNYNEKKTFFGVLDVALHPFSVVRALFHTSYIWDTEISDMQFCNLSTAECILVPNFCVTFYVLDSRNVRSKFHIGIG